MANRINKVTTKSKKYQAPKMENGKMSYTLYDSTGKKVGKTLVAPGTNMSDVSNKFFSKDENGIWQMSDTPRASISIDKDTGKITVAAPSLAIQNENFKKNLDETVDILSSTYKSNPNYKYSTVNEAGENVEKSIDDIIKEMNAPAQNEDGTFNQSSLQYMAAAAASLERKKIAHSKNVELDDNDIVRMDTIAIGPDVKDTTLQLISNLPEAWWLRDIDTYDEATGFAQYGDIMNNAYNKEKVSSDDMIKLWAALENYFEKGDFRDKEEYIRNVATARFLDATQPNMSWIRDVTENVRGFLDGIGGFATELGTAGWVAVERLGSAVLNIPQEYYDYYGNDYGDIYIKRGGNQFDDDMPSEKVDGKIGRIKFDSNAVPTFEKEDIPGGIEDPRTTGEFIRTIFKENRAVIHKDMQYLHASQASWDAIGYIITDLAAVISAGNRLSNMFEIGTSALLNKAAIVAGKTATSINDLTSTARALYSTGTALNFGTTAAEAAQIVSGMKTIYDIAAVTGKAAQFLNFIGQAVRSAKATELIINVVGESLGEAIVGDTDRFVEVLGNREIDTDTKSYLIETYIGNAIGWGIGLGVGKFLMKVGETTRGRAISANLSRRIFKVQNAVGDAFDRSILTIRRIEGDDLADKIESLYNKGGKYAKKQANAMFANMKLREMREVIANMDPIKITGKNADEINKSLVDIEKKINELQKAEVALTSMQRQGVDIVQGWLKDDGRGLKEAADNFYTKASKVADLERTAGDLFKPTKGAVTDLKTGKTLHLFSQATTNYIKATEKIDFINAYIGKYEHARAVTQDVLEKINAYKKELPELQGMVKTFLDNATPELRLAANNFIDADRKWWARFEDLRSNLRLTDPDELSWYRGSNLWGTNGELYARTTRKADLSEYVVKHRDGASNVKTFDTYENYMAGSSGDFADPMGEMQIALYDAGNKQAYRSFTRSYNSLTGSLVTKVSGEDVALYQKMKKGLETIYFDSSERFMKGMVQDVKSGGGIDEVIKNLRLQNEQYTGLVKTKAAMNTTAAKLQGELNTVNSENAARFIPLLNAEDTSDLWDEFYDVSVRELLANGGDYVPDKTRKFIFAQARELGLDASDVEDYPFSSSTRSIAEIDFNEDINRRISDNVIFEEEFWRSPTLRGTTPDASFHTYSIGLDAEDSAKTYGTPSQYDMSDKTIVDARSTSGAEVISDILTRSNNQEVSKFADEFVNIPFGEDRVVLNPDVFKGKSDEFYKEVFTELKKYGIDGFAINSRGLEEAFVATDIIKAPAQQMVNTRLLKTYDAVNATLSGMEDTTDATFENKIKRSILSQNENVLNDTRVHEYLSEQRRLAYEYSTETFLAERTFEYKQLAEEYDITVESLNAASRNVVEGYIEDMTIKNTAQRAAIDELCRYYGLEGDQNAIRYFALSAFMDNKNKYNAKLFDQIKNVVENEHPRFGKTRRDKIAHTIADGITKGIEEEFNDAYLIVKEMNPNAVHEQGERIFDEVKKIADSIEEAESNRYTGNKNVIAMRNMQGKVEYYEADPMLARLVNFQYTPEKLNGLTQAVYNTNYLWAKLFRLGTTAINLKSMMSQAFRDPINMFIGGGAYRTTQQCMDDILDVAGDDVVAWIKTYEPEAFGRLQKIANETGEDITKLAVQREFTVGKAIAPGATETSMYKSLSTAKKARFNGTLDIYDDTAGDKFVRAVDKVGDTLGKGNEWRETTLRNLSYQNGLAKALKRGYSLDEARTYATFIMNEATTNFTRMTNHLVALKDTVPYFGSAINGSKSFFRLLSMDPVGVVGRLVGGLIIPSMALTTYSLLDENNRKVYKNIPEYQKEDALVFVVEGQIISIPVPQELGAFIAPFRQMVEAMNGTTTNTFAQFAWNDILGFSPLELSGFADLDFAKLEQSSPGFLDRIGKGIAKLWSQLAPAPLKSGLEIVTGVDPYTGKEIDKSYLDYDENGNPIVKDYQSGELAKLLNNMFRSWGLSSSAPVVQNIISNIVGQGSVDILDFLVSLGTQVPNGGWAFDATEKELSQGQVYNPFYVLGERITDPITIDAYDEAQSAWKSEVAKLYNLKTEILRSDAWKEYLTAKRSTSDPEKLKNINSSKKDIVENYFNTVKNVVSNLQTNYGEEFTAAKYATVLSLMTMEEQTLDAGAYGDYLNKEEYKTARAQAIQTMINMGFSSSANADILGQYVVNKDGDIYIKTNSPLAILQLDDASGASIKSQSNKQHEAVIRTLISDAGLYDERDKYQKNIKAAFNKKDYSEAEKLTNEYNEKLIRAIGEYIQQYTPESVLKGDTLDYIANYVIVPSSFQINKNGRYASALGNGAYKSDAFKEPYVKYIFNYGENKL